MLINYATEDLCEVGQSVINIEANAVKDLLPRIDHQFAKACHFLLNCQGRIVVTGMGKSGHIGSKIAATLASTGSPAFFVHPGEASHGDMGMITSKDVVLAISYSGNTDELITLLPFVKRLGVPLVTLTGKKDSSLALQATVNLDVSVTEEACPLGLAPTSSTTATLAMGDALAIALLKARGFTEKDFALSHPGGALGRRLLLQVDDIMHTGSYIPKVYESAVISEALIEMSHKGLGMTAIVNETETLLGIFTDGDLRRALNKGFDINRTPISKVMTLQCKTVELGTLAASVVKIMENYKINAVLVIDAHHRLVGALNMHDLLKAKVV